MILGNENKMEKSRRENIYRSFKMKTKYASKLYIIFVSIYFLCVFQLSTILAQENNDLKNSKTLNFSGIITDPSGTIVPDGKYNFTFSLYLERSGGTPIWSEFHQGVNVINGEISVILGSINKDNSLNPDFDRKYFLGIKLNDYQEITSKN